MIFLDGDINKLSAASVEDVAQTLRFGPARIEVRLAHPLCQAFDVARFVSDFASRESVGKCGR